MKEVSISLTIPYWIPSLELVTSWLVFGAFAVVVFSLVCITYTMYSSTMYAKGAGSIYKIEFNSKSKFDLTFPVILLLGPISLLGMIALFIALIITMKKETPEVMKKRHQEKIRKIYNNKAFDEYDVDI